MNSILAVDTGGTFTDLTVYNLETSELRFAKSLTTYGHLVDGIMACIDKVGLDLRDVRLAKFGTTLVINSYVQRNGAKTALVTTRGFRDVLEMRRGNRASPFDIRYRRSPVLVDRALRIEMGGRTDSSGALLEDIATADIEGVVGLLQEMRVEAVAVSLLNSYANPSLEQKVAVAIREALPALYVTAGTDISEEWQEYERTSTAVANAYVGPRIRSYLDSLQAGLKKRNFDAPFYMMASNGGVASVKRAERRPVTLVESGPVGGIIGASAYGEALGIRRLVGFDMGGTTAKCAIIEDGRFAVKSPYYVEGPDHGFPVRGGVLDIVEVGAGGGSIASVDAFGRLQVGPQSAGSEPGPICYGRGGKAVTITDANLVLGRIDRNMLGGSMRLDHDAAHAGLADLAAALGLSGAGAVDEMANGILALAALTMSSAVRQITMERGIDPRRCALLAFGGGGPLHSVSIARELGMNPVIIPPEPGVFSALGMVLSDARIDETKTFIRPLDADVMTDLDHAFAAVEDRLRDELRDELGQVAIAFSREVEMRFRGQHHELRIALPMLDETAIRQAFEARYEQRFGHVVADEPLEFVNIVLVATASLGRLTPGDLAGSAHRGEDPAEPKVREVYFAEIGGRASARVFQRGALPAGFESRGPVLIEEYGSTTVIGPGDHFRIGDLGEIQIRFDGRGEAR